MKKILIILGVILIAFIAYYLTRPSNYRVERTGIIKSSPSEIWPEIVNFKQWANWSAWAEDDPSMENTYEGEDGTLGSKSIWVGETSGSGNMTITSLKPNEEMDYHLQFTAPFASESDGYIKLEKVAEGTKVVMGFFGDHSFMSRFFDMDKNVGPSFERGIANLTKIVESKPKAPVYEVKRDIFPETKYLATKYIGMDQKEVTGELFAADYGKIGSQKVDFSDGAPSALYYSWDVEKGTTDMAVALPLKQAPKKVADGFELIEIKENSCIYINYYGPYGNMEPAHTTLNNYLIDNNLEGDFVAIEEYVTDPGSEPDPSKWLTKISYVRL